MRAMMMIAGLVLGGCGSTEKRHQAEANLHLATVQIEARSGSNVSGTITFEETGVRPDGTRTLRIAVNLSGLTPGEHGFHVHEKGDCSDPKAELAGGHFDLEGNPHGALHDHASHTGDLGNIVANPGGVAVMTLEDVTKVSLSASAPNSIVGRAIVVHASEDDMKSQPSGDAGDRIGCGVIALDR